MGAGDRVILDVGYSNSSEVIIEDLGEIYSRIWSSGFSWHVKTNRLTPRL